MIQKAKHYIISKTNYKQNSVGNFITLTPQTALFCDECKSENYTAKLVAYSEGQPQPDLVLLLYKLYA